MTFICQGQQFIQSTHSIIKIMEKRRSEEKIGIFGGTYEGRILAQFCRSEGIPAAVSVATAYGSQLLEGEISTGRMEAQEMAAWINRQNISAVIDATHPFAQAVSEQIRSACTVTHTEYLRLIRTDPEALSLPILQEEVARGKELPEEFSSILWADSCEEASSLLCRELSRCPEKKALLTTGSKHLSCFTAEKSLLPRLFVRVLPSVEAIQACQTAGFGGKQIIAMQGPFSLEMNQALIHAVQASYLVTKESGQTGGFYEKIRAAWLCGCQVIAIRRPQEEGEGKSLEEIKTWLNTWKKKEKPENTDSMDKTDVIKKIKKIEKTERTEKTDSIQNANPLQNSADPASAGLKKKPVSPREITLLGIGMGNPEQLTWEGIQALGKADAFLGASRMVESGKELCRQFFSQLPLDQQREWTALSDKQERITYKKEEMLSWLKEHPEILRPVILFSGDTGFYSGAKGVLELLKENGFDSNLRLLPGISSLSCFAAKIGRSWDQAEPLSFHGREEEMDWSLSDGKERFFLLDGTERLHEICRRLIAHGQSEAAVWTGENLSYPTERIVCQKPEAVLKTTFEPLLVSWIIPA